MKQNIDPIEIGKFGKPVGLKGNVVINLYNKNVDFDHFYTEILIRKQDCFTHYKVEKIYSSNSKILAKLVGFETREDVLQLLNQTIYSYEVDFSDKNLAQGEFFYAKLLGAEVLDSDLNKIGEITDILNTGPYEVFQILNDENKEMMVPSVKELISEIREGKVILTPYGSEVANIC